MIRASGLGACEESIPATSRIGVTTIPVHLPVLASDWAAVADDLVKSLVWPVTVLIIFFVLRKPIAGVIPFIEELRYKDLSMRFQQRLNKAEHEAAQAQLPPSPAASKRPQDLPLTELPDYLYPMAASSPTAAVLEAWARIEQEMRRSVAAAGVPLARTLRDLTRSLITAQILPSNAQGIVDDLYQLRNQVAHVGVTDLDVDGAFRYLELGNRLLAAMNRGSTQSSTH